MEQKIVVRGKTISQENISHERTSLTNNVTSFEARSSSVSKALEGARRLLNSTLV